MDELTPTATTTIPTWTVHMEALTASILATPEGGPPETTNLAEGFAYYLAKSTLQVERTHKIRFLNPHITTFTLIVLACLWPQWPKKTTQARLTDLLAMTLSLALLFPQNIHLSLLASNLSLFYLSWTLIPGPYAHESPPNLPDWPTLLASLPRKPYPEDSQTETAEEGDRSDECMICWTPPLPSVPLLQLPCAHLACKPCLDLLFPSTSPTNTTPPTAP
ncbi:hypothetical protein KC319_g14569, partial [Hortaea werneckii]